MTLNFTEAAPPVVTRPVSPEMTALSDQIKGLKLNTSYLIPDGVTVNTLRKAVGLAGRTMRIRKVGEKTYFKLSDPNATPATTDTPADENPAPAATTPTKRATARK